MSEHHHDHHRQLLLLRCSVVVLDVEVLDVDIVVLDVDIVVDVVDVVDVGAYVDDDVAINVDVDGDIARHASFIIHHSGTPMQSRNKD